MSLLVVSAQVSLYYDLLPAACSGVSQAEFVSGRCGKGLARGRVACPARAAAARRLVWTELRPFRMVEVVLPGSVVEPKLFFTVPVPTFEKLWFRFRFQLLKSYGYCSGSSSYF